VGLRAERERDAVQAFSRRPAPVQLDEVPVGPAGEPGGGAPALQNVTYQGDTNLADPIVAPFVTKAQATLTLATPVAGLPATVTTTAVTDQTLWGNVYGNAHGGVCTSS